MNKDFEVAAFSICYALLAIEWWLKVKAPLALWSHNANCTSHSLHRNFVNTASCFSKCDK